jgi:hypothetical protein
MLLHKDAAMYCPTLLHLVWLIPYYTYISINSICNNTSQMLGPACLFYVLILSSKFATEILFVP